MVQYDRVHRTAGCSVQHIVLNTTWRSTIKYTELRYNQVNITLE